MPIISVIGRGEEDQFEIGCQAGPQKIQGKKIEKMELLS